MKKISTGGGLILVILSCLSPLIAYSSTVLKHKYSAGQTLTYKYTVSSEERDSTQPDFYSSGEFNVIIKYSVTGGGYEAKLKVPLGSNVTKQLKDVATGDLIEETVEDAAHEEIFRFDSLGIEQNHESIFINDLPGYYPFPIFSSESLNPGDSWTYKFIVRPMPLIDEQYQQEANYAFHWIKNIACGYRLCAEISYTLNFNLDQTLLTDAYPAELNPVATYELHISGKILWDVDRGLVYHREESSEVQATVDLPRRDGTRVAKNINRNRTIKLKLLE